MFVTSQANNEGITPKPTHKSATASEIINALVSVAEISSAADEVDCYSISSDSKNRKNPAKNPKPGLHLQKQLREVLINYKWKEKYPLRKNIRGFSVIQDVRY